MNYTVKEIAGNLEGLAAVQLVLERGGQLREVPCLPLSETEMQERRIQILEQVKNFADWNAIVETVQIKCGGVMYKGIFAYADEPAQTPTPDAVN